MERSKFSKWSFENTISWFFPPSRRYVVSSERKKISLLTTGFDLFVKRQFSFPSVSLFFLWNKKTVSARWGSQTDLFISKCWGIRVYLLIGSSAHHVGLDEEFLHIFKKGFRKISDIPNQNFWVRLVSKNAEKCLFVI